VVAELGTEPGLDQIYRLTYDGSVGDEANFAVMGGSADLIAEVVGRGFSPGLSLPEAAQLAVRALSSDGGPNAAPRVLGVEALEVAVLDRTRAMPRKFRRIKGDRLAALLADGSGSAADADAPQRTRDSANGEEDPPKKPSAT
jgi:proteasome alpha subunit